MVINALMLVSRRLVIRPYPREPGQTDALVHHPSPVPRNERACLISSSSNIGTSALHRQRQSIFIHFGSHPALAQSRSQSSEVGELPGIANGQQ